MSASCRKASNAKCIALLRGVKVTELLYNQCILLHFIAQVVVWQNGNKKLIKIIDG